MPASDFLPLTALQFTMSTPSSLTEQEAAILREKWRLIASSDNLLLDTAQRDEQEEDNPAKSQSVFR